MERVNFFCYNMGHETPWIPRGTGKAPPARDRVAERKQDDSVCRSAFGGSIEKLRFPMVPRVPRGRVQGPSFKGDSRTSSEAVSKGEKEISGTTFVRSAGCRVSNRPLDLETDCPNHPKALWHPLSPQSCVARASRDGMELPETRAAGFAEERERDCALEGLSVAPYKKKPKDLGPIWSSSMNPGFCLFLMSLVPGHPRGRPLSFTISISKTEFLPSVVFRCPPKEGAWPFIFGFAHAISQVWMSVLSLKACSNISGGRWFCCGIGEPSTDGKKSSNFFLVIRDCTFITFPPTHRNSTRQNMFGIRLTVPFPTVRQRTWRSLKGCFVIRCGAYGGAPKNFSGPVSMLPIYHGYGENKSFHYLCKIQ